MPRCQLQRTRNGRVNSKINITATRRKYRQEKTKDLYPNRHRLNSSRRNPPPRPRPLPLAVSPLPHRPNQTPPNWRKSRKFLAPERGGGKRRVRRRKRRRRRKRKQWRGGRERMMTASTEDLLRRDPRHRPCARRRVREARLRPLEGEEE